MAIDLRNEHGELDRGRVIDEINRLFALLPIPDTTICQSAKTSIRDGVVDLMDELHQAAWQDGNRTGYMEAVGDMSEYIT